MLNKEAFYEYNQLLEVIEIIPKKGLQLLQQEL